MFVFILIFLSFFSTVNASWNVSDVRNPVLENRQYATSLSKDAKKRIFECKIIGLMPILSDAGLIIDYKIAEILIGKSDPEDPRITIKKYTLIRREQCDKWFERMSRVLRQADETKTVLNPVLVTNRRSHTASLICKLNLKKSLKLNLNKSLKSGSATKRIHEVLSDQLYPHHGKELEVEKVSDCKKFALSYGSSYIPILSVKNEFIPEERQGDNFREETKKVE